MTIVSAVSTLDTILALAEAGWFTPGEGGTGRGLGLGPAGIDGGHVHHILTSVPGLGSLTRVAWICTSCNCCRSE